MNPVLKNILAVIAGIIIGSIVNMGLILLGHHIIPGPEGVDFMNPDSLKANMHLFEHKHFVFPFLGHAIGTLVGALMAHKIAAKRKATMALIVGIFFLFGGVMNAFNLGGPTWFNTLDLVLAYIPMAWIGAKLAS